MDFEVEVAQIIAARAERRAAFKKLPYISVVMATARPDDLTNILTQIEAQTLPSFELLLGVHKFQLSPSHKKQLVRLQKRGISVVTKNFTVAYTLGSVLSTMAAQSTGEYIAKMDDDDIYGPDHHCSPRTCDRNFNIQSLDRLGLWRNYFGQTFRGRSGGLVWRR